MPSGSWLSQPWDQNLVLVFKSVSECSFLSCCLRAADMQSLEAAVTKVEHEIDHVEADIKTAVAQGRVEDARQLRRKEEQLRRKEEQLRAEELIPLRASGKQYHLYLQHADIQYKLSFEACC